MAAADGGAIVNVASIRSLAAGPKCVQYDTARAAVLGLTRSMARDHAAEGVRVDAVGPGPILTPHHERRAGELGQTRESCTEAFGAETVRQSDWAKDGVVTARRGTKGPRRAPPRIEVTIAPGLYFGISRIVVDRSLRRL